MFFPIAAVSMRQAVHPDSQLHIAWGAAILAAVFACALAVRASCIRAGMFFDDALITMRVSRNIASGAGYTYNPGAHVQAASSLSWALIGAAFWKLVGARAFLAMRALGALLDSIAAALLSLFVLFGLGDSSDGRGPVVEATAAAAALIAGLFYATVSTASLVAASGLETGLYTAIVMLAFLLQVRKKTLAAVIVSVFAVTIRPDAILLAIVILGWIYFDDRDSFYPAFRICAASATAYVAGVWAYFGSIVPQTVIAKNLVVHSAGTAWLDFAHRLFLGAALPAGILALIGLPIACANRAMRPFFIWAILYAACFSTGGSWWPWYLPPVMLAYAAAIGISVSLILVILSGLAGTPRFARAAGVMLALIVALGGWRHTASKLVRVSDRARIENQCYGSVGDRLAALSAPDETVMIEPLGMVGFRTNRTFYDYPGLASPRTTQALHMLHRGISMKPDQPAVVSFLLRKVQPDWLVLREDEYLADSAGGALGGCRLADTVPVARSDSAEFPDLQTMYLLHCGGAGTDRHVQVRRP